LDKAPETVVEQDFEGSDILQKVLALPQKYKTAIYLYYYEGYSTPEIAKMMKKPQSTVRNWLYTGRKLLKLEMEGEQT
jgi:RNA polymerase sigma factor (sigma-70 family)